MKFRKETYRNLHSRVSTDFSIHYKECHANKEVHATEQTKPTPKEQNRYHFNVYYKKY